MEFTIQIEQEVFEEALKTALARQIKIVVQSSVDKSINDYRTKIEHAVDLHLSKRLTNKDIESEMEKAVTRIVQDRILNMDINHD